MFDFLSNDTYISANMRLFDFLSNNTHISANMRLICLTFDKMEDDLKNVKMEDNLKNFKM